SHDISALECIAFHTSILNVNRGMSRHLYNMMKNVEDYNIYRIDLERFIEIFNSQNLHLEIGIDFFKDSRRYENNIFHLLQSRGELCILWIFNNRFLIKSQTTGEVKMVGDFAKSVKINTYSSFIVFVTRFSDIPYEISIEDFKNEFSIEFIKHDFTKWANSGNNVDKDPIEVVEKIFTNFSISRPMKLSSLMNIDHEDGDIYLTDFKTFYKINDSEI